MAMAGKPRLIIADEPTTALDVTIQAQILELLRDLKARLRMSILLITHNLGIVGDIADRVAVMYAGQIVELSPARALLQRPLHPYTQALLAAIPIPDPVIEATRPQQIISGEVPSAMRPPPGCRFHTRCPHARDICSATEPTAPFSTASSMTRLSSLSATMSRPVGSAAPPANTGVDT